MLYLVYDCSLISSQIEDHPLVLFLPLDLTDPNSIENVLSHIDFTMQYGEDKEPCEVVFLFFISSCMILIE
jgi:hypothetical protein